MGELPCLLGWIPGLLGWVLFGLFLGPGVGEWSGTTLGPSTVVFAQLPVAASSASGAADRVFRVFIDDQSAF